MCEKRGAPTPQIAIPERAERITGGETGALLYRFDGRVVKLAQENVGLSEIRNNIWGYEGIRRAGAIDILPKNIRWGSNGTQAWIDMPDLGLDMGKRDLAGQDLQREYELFSTKVVTLVHETLQDDNLQHAGLEVLKKQLGEWLVELSHTYTELFSHGVIDEFMQLNFRGAASTISTVMIQDFTPDNIFVQDESVAFIDPWAQQTYRGSMVPSMAQYYTNAVEVREFSSAVAAAPLLKDALAQISSMLGLSDVQMGIQCEMGRALQYLLSSFVRIHSEPDRSKRYALEASRGIENVKILLKELQ